MLIIRVALVLLCCAAVAAECLDLGALGECSGNGKCINNTCVCDKDFAGRNPWMDQSGIDCHTSESAVWYSACVAAIAGLIQLLLGCTSAFQAWFHKPEQMFSLHRQFAASCMVGGLLQLVAFVCIIANYYPSQNTAVMVLVFFWVCIAFTKLSIPSRLGLRIYLKHKNTRSIVYKSLLGRHIASLVVGLVVACLIVAIRIQPEGAGQVNTLRACLVISGLDLLAHLVFVYVLSSLVGRKFDLTTPVPPNLAAVETYGEALREMKLVVTPIFTIVLLADLVLLFFPQAVAYVLPFALLLLLVEDISIYNRLIGRIVREYEDGAVMPTASGSSIPSTKNGTISTIHSSLEAFSESSK